MLLKLYEENPAPRLVRILTETLEKGGVIIYPTDTVYGIGCDIYNHKAVAKLVDEHLYKNVDHSKYLSKFINFEIWHRLFIDKKLMC